MRSGTRSWIRVSIVVAAAWAGSIGTAWAGHHHTSGFARGVTPAQAASNYAHHSAPVPWVSLSPAHVTAHSDGSYSASRNGSMPFGQHLSSNAHFSPGNGGTHFTEDTSGTAIAEAAHSVYYTPSTIAHALGGR
jgi:hypothetical protein